MLAFLLLTLIVCANANDEKQECKCWENYEASTFDSGMRCCGKFDFFCRACNEPQQPTCVCKEDESTSVMIDPEGTWCATIERGEIAKKWPCENMEEWKTYTELHLNFIDKNQE